MSASMVFTILVPGLFIVSFVALLRTGLILMGLLKGPILHTFEKYGDDENVYYPLPSILLWLGVMLISISPWLAAGLGDLGLAFVPGLALLLAAWIAFNNPQLALQFPALFMRYPRWYWELRERTSRQERRRIAYMWLWMPPRARLTYNGSDHAFNHWVDLVILSMLATDGAPPEWRELPSRGLS